ncbi:50S ribosomal protein L25 [Candidatus Gracilibacteria bacterium]|nr:50S ribosomal protein L25 [Candidatus Gracilibacteria bacterium]
MTDNFTLATEKRKSSKHSARNTRQTGKVPGVIYGHGIDSIAVSIGYSDLLKTFRKAGQSSIIDLTIDGKTTKVLIHQYTLDPVKNTFTHIDFLAINMKEKTMVRIPLRFVGESDAVKNLGGVFLTNHNELEIRCFPSEIPHEIKVDISSLENLHDHISIADLDLPETLELMNLDKKTILCSITGRAAEEEALIATEGIEGEEEASSEEGEEASEENSK